MFVLVLVLVLSPINVHLYPDALVEEVVLSNKTPLTVFNGNNFLFLLLFLFLCVVQAPQPMDVKLEGHIFDGEERAGNDRRVRVEVSVSKTVTL
jgi:hypothetical protein